MISQNFVLHNLGLNKEEYSVRRNKIKKYSSPGTKTNGLPCTQLNALVNVAQYMAIAAKAKKITLKFILIRFSRLKFRKKIGEFIQTSNELNFEHKFYSKNTTKSPDTPNTNFFPKNQPTLQYCDTNSLNSRTELW